MIFKFLKKLFTRKPKEVSVVHSAAVNDLPTFSIRNKEGERIPFWKVDSEEMKEVFDGYRKEAENTTAEQSKKVLWGKDFAAKWYVKL